MRGSFVQCPGNYYIDGFYMPLSDLNWPPSMEGIQIHRFRYEHDHGMGYVENMGTAYDPAEDSATRPQEPPDLWKAVLHQRIGRTEVSSIGTPAASVSAARSGLASVLTGGPSSGSAGVDHMTAEEVAQWKRRRCTDTSS